MWIGVKGSGWQTVLGRMPSLYTDEEAPEKERCWWRTVLGRMGLGNECRKSG